MEHINNIKFGDYFKIGNHYILCGDSTDSISIKYFFNKINLMVDLVFADPPYGMDKEILNDKLKGDNLLDFNIKF
jgi:DNA modification methylase